MMHYLGGNRLICAPNIDDRILYSLEDEGCEIILGGRELKGRYPEDIAYNAARLGDLVICNLANSDEILLTYINSLGIRLINVKQGYSKCSICIVDKESIITSDKGIHDTVLKNGIESLLITPGNIDISGMNYGFIGGASGSLSNNSIGFTGNINNHPDFNKIFCFLQKHGKKSINLSKNRLVDMGTIIPIKEYSIMQA
jgi:hypothetical protein